MWAFAVRESFFQCYIIRHPLGYNVDMICFFPSASIWDFLEPFIRLLSGESSHSQAWAIASFPCVFLGNMVRSTDAEATLPGSRSWLYLLWFNNPKSLLPYLLKKCLCHRFVQRMAWDDRCKVLSWMPGIWKRHRPWRTGVVSIHRWCWVSASLHHPDCSTPSPCPWNDLRLTSPVGTRIWFCPPDPLHYSAAS